MSTPVHVLWLPSLSSCLMTLALCACATADDGEPRFIDHSLLVAPEYPATWPSAPFPLNGNSEGWPAPGPDTIVYLKEKRIRCVASDAPDLGGVDPRRALMTYWALGSRDMVGVEFLVNV